MKPEQLLADKGRYEPVASLIVRQALAEGRSAELLLSLMAGAACTINQSGRLEIVWLNTPVRSHGVRIGAPGQLDPPREAAQDFREELASFHESREFG